MKTSSQGWAGPRFRLVNRWLTCQRSSTYTNNTSDAQIQISLLGYNLGQRARRGWEKREGYSGCRDKRGRGEKAPISQLTHSLQYDLNTFTGEGGGNLGRSRLHVFLTPGYRWRVLKFSFFLHHHARQTNPYQLLRSPAIVSQTIKRNKNHF